MGQTLSPLRSETRRLIGTNPLIRRSDRVEALTILLAVIVAVAALPAVVYFGFTVHDARAHDIERHAASVHSVEAWAVSDSAPVASAVPARVTVTAQWVQGSDIRTDTLRVDHPLKAGERFTVWLDSDQEPTSPPAAPRAAVGDAFVAALAVYCAATGVVACALLAILGAISLVRQRHWDLGLQQLIAGGGDAVDRRE